jgi:hypothetical protein
MAEELSTCNNIFLNCMGILYCTIQSGKVLQLFYSLAILHIETDWTNGRKPSVFGQHFKQKWVLSFQEGGIRKLFLPVRIPKENDITV